MELNILDLFAGAGGFSLGFHLEGHNIVGAIETDSWACETFAYNHPESIVIKSKIEELSDEKIKKTFGNKKIDVIVGGPPCQGFSICNKNAGDPKDPRNTLFKEFIRVASILKPQILILENVPNLLNAKTEKKELVVEIIKEEMAALGYYAYHTVLEATSFGVPQARKRLIVLASKYPLDNPFPTATHSVNPERDGLKKCPTLWEAISDLPRVAPKQGAEEMEYNSAPKNEFQKWVRKNCKNKVYNHLSMKHSPRMIERFASMKWGESVSDVADHLKPFKRNSNGVISDKAYDQNNRRQHPDKACNTITASFYANFVHPYEHRNFTAREGARIQSFPDWYVFKGKPTVVSRMLLQREGRFDENYLCQYNQIGNAVPPMMAQAMAKNLVKQLTLLSRKNAKPSLALTT